MEWIVWGLRFLIFQLLIFYKIPLFFFFFLNTQNFCFFQIVVDIHFFKECTLSNSSFALFFSYLWVMTFMTFIFKLRICYLRKCIKKCCLKDFSCWEIVNLCCLEILFWLNCGWQSLEVAFLSWNIYETYVCHLKIFASEIYFQYFNLYFFFLFACICMWSLIFNFSISGTAKRTWIRYCKRCAYLLNVKFFQLWSFQIFLPFSFLTC